MGRGRNAPAEKWAVYTTLRAPTLESQKVARFAMLNHHKPMPEIGMQLMTGEKQKDRVHGAVVALLRKNPRGLRYSQLMQAVQQMLPDAPMGTIKNCFQLMTKEDARLLYTTSPGLWCIGPSVH